MASRARLSYQRLKKLSADEIDTVTDQKDVAAAAAAADQPANQVVVQRSKKNAWRAAASGGGGSWLRRLRWRRPRVRVAGLIRRLLQGGRKGRGGAKVVIRSAVAKVVKRLKEGKPYLGELFAGNYMFMQVSPSPTMAYVDKSFLPRPPAVAVGGLHYHHANGGVCTAPPSAGFGVPRN